MIRIILSAILLITSSFLTSSFGEVGDVYYCETTAHSRIDFSSNKLTNVYKSLGSIKISFKWEKNNRITFGQKSDWMAGETWVIYHQTAQSFLFHRDHNNMENLLLILVQVVLVGQNPIGFTMLVH